MTAKRQWSVMKLLVLDFHRWMQNPAIARIVLLSKKNFTTPLLRTIVLELVCADGDINHAVAALRGHSQELVQKFCRWCDKVRGGAL